MGDINEKDRNDEGLRKHVPHHGQNVKWFRKKLDYSQEYLGKRIGESQQTIGEWEKCAFLSDDKLEKIAKELEIGMKWLRDVVLEPENDIYIFEGHSTNFVKSSSHIANAIHPLESLDNAYKNTITIIERTFKESLETIKAELVVIKEEKQRILEKYLKLLEGKDK